MSAALDDGGVAHDAGVVAGVAGDPTPHPPRGVEAGDRGQLPAVERQCVNADGDG